MPVMPGELTKASARLRPLWSFWSKHLLKYYLPAYGPPRKPPLKRLPFLKGQVDKVNDKLQMLLELDRQVEAAWKERSVKDNDRKLAADKIISTWEAKMHSYSNVRLDGTPDIGLSVNQIGQAFRRAHTDKARREGPGFHLCQRIWQAEGHKHCACLHELLQGLIHSHTECSMA